jgi:hypothetical protein
LQGKSNNYCAVWLSRFTFTLYSTMNQRLIAHFLLFLFAMHWVAGVAYVKITRSLEMGQVMTEREQQIADEMKQQYAIQSAIDVIDAQRMEHLLRLGYGTPYLYYHQSQHATPNYFTLTNDSAQTLTYEKVLLSPHQQDWPDSDTKNTMLEQFFPDLELPESVLWLYSRSEVTRRLPFLHHLMVSSRILDTLVPPPWLV